MKFKSASEGQDSSCGDQSQLRLPALPLSLDISQVISHVTMLFVYDLILLIFSVQWQANSEGEGT